MIVNLNLAEIRQGSRSACQRKDFVITKQIFLVLVRDIETFVRRMDFSGQCRLKGKQC